MRFIKYMYIYAAKNGRIYRKKCNVSDEFKKKIVAINIFLLIIIVYIYCFLVICRQIFSITWRLIDNNH